MTSFHSLIIDMFEIQEIYRSVRFYLLIYILL
nr:MAG TPA: hypothetical protein [Caudoviricetes sp.]